MNIESELKKLGLTGNESKLYLELLRRGSISANELAKKLGFDRTLTYQVLNNLIEKGLVNYIIKENKKYFEPSNPENLLNPIKEKESLALNLIPQLKSIEKIHKEEQEVKVYEGKRGLKVLLEDVLSSKNVCIFGATGKSYEILKFEMPHLIKKAEKTGLSGRMITSLEYKNHQMSKIKGIKTRYLETMKGPATTMIYEDKVSMHVLTEKPLIVIIKNKEIADSYRDYFETLWKIAKK